MIDKWLTANEIAEILGIAIRSVQRRAVKEHWVSRNQKGNGGTHRIFQLATLPEDIQAAYAASLQMPLEALQNQLKPPPKAPVKVTIGGYKAIYRIV
jgi:hypothetical protein